MTTKTLFHKQALASDLGDWEGLLSKSVNPHEIHSLLEDGRFRLRLLRALEQQDIHTRSLAEVAHKRDESEW